MSVANSHLKSYRLPSSKKHQMKTEFLLSVIELYLEYYSLYAFLSIFLPLFKRVNYDLEAKLIHPQYP